MQQQKKEGMSFMKTLVDFFLELYWYFIDLLSWVKRKFKKDRYIPYHDFVTQKQEVIKNEPDAILFREAKALDLELSYFTVPLTVTKGDNFPDDLLWYGSGVLVKIVNHHFLFSAGHCIRDIDNHSVFLAIDSKKHRFKLQLGKKNYVKTESGLDYGYCEISPIDASMIEAKKKIFLSTNRINVLNRRTLLKANDWIVVSGYPGDKRKEVQPQNLGIQQVHVSTIACGTGVAPWSRIQPLRKDCFD
jgi:hypothetical protein